MSRFRNVIRWMIAIAAILVAIVAAYRVGYRDGLRDKGPQRRALIVVRRDPNNPSSSGRHATWFDISKPEDVVRLREAEERLKSIGAEYYIAKARVETTIMPEPDPRRANSHR